jgi:hypothetical protein
MPMIRTHASLSPDRKKDPGIEAGRILRTVEELL